MRRALDESEPKGVTGALQYDPEKLKARRQAWLRTLGGASGEVIVVLVARHDLGQLLRVVTPITVPAVKSLMQE